MTVAKGLTNGAVPMGAVLVDRDIYAMFMTGPEHAVEFAHGYTYSGHPLATAAALASLDVYQEEGLFQRAADTGVILENAIHSLNGAPHVIDIRNIGMMAAIELEPRDGEPGLRALEVFRRCFEAGIVVRPTRDTIALSPSLIISKGQIEQLVSVISDTLTSID